jgi:hypothetical protein
VPTVIAILAGTLLLLFGRRLFWLCIAIFGFLVGAEIARDVLAGRPEWVVWALGACAGLVGAAAAMLLQRVAIGLAGFYAGAYLALLVVPSLAWPVPELAAILVGGALGAVAAVLVTDPAIIVLSSVVGAWLIVGSQTLASLPGAMLAMSLAALGTIVQARTLRGRSEPRAGVRAE